MGAPFEIGRLIQASLQRTIAFDLVGTHGPCVRGGSRASRPVRPGGVVGPRAPCVGGRG